MRFLPATTLALMAAIGASRALLRGVDRAVNRVHRRPPASISLEARRLHGGLWIADLHCDALLWSRDLRRRTRRGHVDLPRLREGRLGLQVFSTPNRFPLGANYRRTPRGLDLLAPLAVASGWHPATWISPVRRALHQAGALRRLADASGGDLRVIESRDDLAGLDAATGALLSLEGIHGVGDDRTALDVLFDAGFRIFGIVHMTDTALGGSAHGWRQGGLTPAGRRALVHLESRGAIVDLAHASERTIDDALDTLTRAPLVSHTGVRGTCPGNRNLSDRNLERIAARGGLIGIAFFPAAVGGRDAGAVARAIRHAVAVGGADHVALGSDFDGAVGVPFDCARLVELTAALVEAGLDEDTVARVMGLNARRFLLGALPVAPS